MKFWLKVMVSTLVMMTLLAFAGFSGACEEIRKDVFRLHILANSDSEEDQALKLEIRDDILTYTDQLFRNCHSKEEAMAQAESHLGELTEYTNELVRKKGYSYGAAVSVRNMSFQTRVYENFTLPAGRYDALRIELGKGEGKNWWCVVYPGLCLPGSDGSELSQVMNEGEQDIVTDSEPYAIGFKLAEVFQWLTSLFSH